MAIIGRVVALVSLFGICLLLRAPGLQGDAVGTRAGLKPKQLLLLHIGPHKTGSSFVQWVLRKLDKQLHDQNAIALYTNDMRNQILSNLRAGQRTVIASNEDMSVWKANTIVALHDGVSELNAQGHQIDVKVVVVYREFISLMKSHYLYMAKEPEFELGFLGGNTHLVGFHLFLLNAMEDLGVQYGGPIYNIDLLIDNWCSIFGRESVVAIDYYGVQAADRDLAHAIICGVGGLFCDDSYATILPPTIIQRKHLESASSKNSAGREEEANVGYNSSVAREVMDIVRDHALLRGCNLNPYKLHEVFATVEEMSAKFIAKCHSKGASFNTFEGMVCTSLPTITTDLAFYGAWAAENEARVTHAHGDILQYRNETANLANLRANNHMINLDLRHFLRHPRWVEMVHWMSREMQKEELIKCNTK